MKVMGKSSLSAFVMALINIGWYGTMILLALSVCLLAIAPWVDPPRVEVGLAAPAAFAIEPRTHPVTASPSGVENVHLEDGRGSLRFSPRSRVVVAGIAAVIIAALALTMWMLGELRAVFRTLRAGQPFVAANAVRIRRIAYAVLIGELCADTTRIHRHALRNDQLRPRRRSLRGPARPQRRRGHLLASSFW